MVRRVVFFFSDFQNPNIHVGYMYFKSKIVKHVYMSEYNMTCHSESCTYGRTESLVNFRGCLELDLSITLVDGESAATAVGRRAN